MKCQVNTTTSWLALGFCAWLHVAEGRPLASDEVAHLKRAPTVSFTCRKVDSTAYTFNTYWIGLPESETGYKIGERLTIATVTLLSYVAPLLSSCRAILGMLTAHTTFADLKAAGAGDPQGTTIFGDRKAYNDLIIDYRVTDSQVTEAHVAWIDSDVLARDGTAAKPAGSQSIEIPVVPEKLHISVEAGGQQATGSVGK